MDVSVFLTATLIQLLVLFFAAVSNAEAATEAAADDASGVTCSFSDVPVDAVFAVDTSNSVSWQDYFLGMKFVGRFIDFLGKNHPNTTRFGMFQYSDQILHEVNFSFHSDWTTLSTNVAQADRLTGLETHTVTALKTMLNEFKEAEPRNETGGVIRLGFIITDGESHQPRVAAAAADLTAFNVSVYGIGIGAVNMTELETVTGSKNRTFYAKNYEHLDDIEEKFHKKVCTTIDSNRLVEIAKISGGVLAAIVIAVLVGLLIIYRAQSVIRRKLELSRLAAAEDALKKTSSDVNPMYKTPITQVDAAALGLDAADG